jgi:hypothetical protein
MDQTPPPTTYLFRMDRWTPASLPAKRMAEYMTKLASLFGSPDGVHFSKVRSGSHRQLFEVDPACAPLVRDRLHAANDPQASQDLANIRRDINKMLLEDGQVGYVKAEPGPKILEFPGRMTRIADEVTVHQTGSIDGTVIRVGGRDSSVPVSIDAGDGIFHRCSTTRQIAKRLAPHLFESDIRLHGKGKWFRGGDGAWELLAFEISDFEVLTPDSLEAFVKDMRAIDGSEWNAIADPQAKLKDFRGS